MIRLNLDELTEEDVRRLYDTIETLRTKPAAIVLGRDPDATEQALSEAGDEITRLREGLEAMAEEAVKGIASAKLDAANRRAADGSCSTEAARDRAVVFDFFRRGAREILGGGP